MGDGVHARVNLNFELIYLKGAILVGFCDNSWTSFSCTKNEKNYLYPEFLITVVRHKKRRSNRCTTYFSVFRKLKRLKSVWSFWNMNFEHLLCYKFVCVYYIWSLHYYFTLSDLFIHIEHICWLNQLVLSYF